MTWGAVGSIAMAVGSGVVAYSQYQQGKTAAAQARQEAAWHDYNAKVAKREAEAERKAAEFESTQHERKAKQLLARQRALIGASGVTMEGSPLLLAEDTAAQLALENINIRMTGARRVGAWKSKSILDISKARFARESAPGLRRAGYLSAGSSLLQGAGTVAYMSQT